MSYVWAAYFSIKIILYVLMVAAGYFILPWPKRGWLRVVCAFAIMNLILLPVDVVILWLLHS